MVEYCGENMTMQLYQQKAKPDDKMSLKFVVEVENHYGKQYFYLDTIVEALNLFEKIIDLDKKNLLKN